MRIGHSIGFAFLPSPMSLLVFVGNIVDLNVTYEYHIFVFISLKIMYTSHFCVADAFSVALHIF